jgi:DNA polymerase zeta
MNFKPVILEPPKQYFADPVAVFDFQSLYPSIMISHNICYSTCLGKFGEALTPDGQVPLGFLHNNLGFGGIGPDDLHILSNGSIFVKESVLKGVVPQMLEEFLLTRIFLKKALKSFDEELQRRLENQQKSLKLFMNTTFGYTGAGFTGRMPMVELAEAVVATARQIVSQSINIITALSPRFEVIYGDTDSIFVMMKGMTVGECFDRAKAITAAVTDALPSPIELKFEKVYKPSVYYSKKRYCGFKFETPSGPCSFEAKGTESIRRDTSKVAKTLVTDLTTTLFQTNDLSQLREKLEVFCAETVSGSVDTSHFIVHKKYRSRETKVDGIPKILNQRNKDRDKMAYFLERERVPYLIIDSGTTAKLKETVT